MSLSFARFGIKADQPLIRIALQINGQKKDQERYYPLTASVKSAPRAWIPARLLQ
jgi:hypothetical protein